MTGTQDFDYDVLGIGLGPFGLGMAALIDPLVRSGEITAAFLDRRAGFSWHPGMMLDEATLQVPFIADLVTFADPTSRYSFLNFLKDTGRIYRFYIRESFYPFRPEYSEYARWVAAQLDHVHWSSPVTSVHREPGGGWRVEIAGDRPESVTARVVVNATGTIPRVPAGFTRGGTTPTGMIHSSEFLDHVGEIRSAGSVTIVGSGQSAAEIYRHVMEGRAAEGRELNWLSRSPRFFPMEYAGLSLELTSPDYIHRLRGLSEARRDDLLDEQRVLYKGISRDLVDDIYDTLYRLSITTPLPGLLRPDVTVRLAPEETGEDESGRLCLELVDNETGVSTRLTSDIVILATGYSAPNCPEHLAGVEEINRDSSGRMAVAEDFSVTDEGDLFVLNAEEHLHGINAPDLGMGPWRNSVIINRIAGREVYRAESSTVFQSFGGAPQ